MFENLSNKLDRAFKVLKGQGRITEINVAATIKEIRRALIDADVDVLVVWVLINDLLFFFRVFNFCLDIAGLS